MAEQSNHTDVQEVPKITMVHRAMATQFECIMYGDEDTHPEVLTFAAEEAFNAVDALEQSISSWISTSTTSHVNRHAATQAVKVDLNFMNLLRCAKQVYKDTGGAFDVTVGPFLDLWRLYGKQEGQLPSEAELKKAEAIVGLDQVLLDETAWKVQFTQPGMRLDFGGIGKGLAVDRMAYVLESKGVKDFLVHGGGSTMRVLGSPPGKDGWTITQDTPYNISDAYTADILKSGEALSFSSGDEKGYDIAGKHYGHIIDPRTGWPVQTDVRSITVIAPNGMLADALSTAFYVLGEDGTRAYCASHPEIRVVLEVKDQDTYKQVHLNFDKQP